MLPVNPFPPIKLGGPLLFLGLAAGATAVALWARRQLNREATAPRPVSSRVGRLLRVEPVERLDENVELPWVKEAR